MCSLTLPLLRSPVHVLLSKLLEIVIHVVLCIVGDCAHLIYELLYVSAIRTLGAMAFALELGLPACLLGQKVRVRSLSRLDKYWLRRIFFLHLEYRLNATNNWLGRSAGIGLNRKLWRSPKQEVLDFNKNLLDTHQTCSVNDPIPVGLIYEVRENAFPHIIALLPYVVIIESTVLLRLNVLGSEHDALKVDAVRAVHARKELALLIKRQPLALELEKGVFPNIGHAKRYLFNN